MRGQYGNTAYMMRKMFWSTHKSTRQEKYSFKVSSFKSPVTDGL